MSSVPDESSTFEEIPLEIDESHSPQLLKHTPWNHSLAWSHVKIPNTTKTLGRIEEVQALFDDKSNELIKELLFNLKRDHNISCKREDLEPMERFFEKGISLIKLNVGIDHIFVPNICCLKNSCPKLLFLVTIIEYIQSIM